jgi:hypothetical protein
LVTQPEVLKSAFAGPEMPRNAKTLPSTFQKLTIRQSCSGPSGYLGELAKPRVMSARARTVSLLTIYEAREKET